MHWLLWLSLTEAEPSNVSRQKHASCTDTCPYKHAGFIAKPERNQRTSRISLRWSLQLQITHQIVRIQYEVLMMCGYRVRLHSWSPAAEPTFAFIPGLAARKGLEPPSASVMALTGTKALDWPWDAPHHGCKTSQPLAQAGGTGFPTLARQHPQNISHCQDGHLRHGELGCKLRLGDRSWGAWFEERDGQTGTRDKQHRAPYCFRHKTQKSGGPSVQNYLTYFSKYSVRHSPYARLNRQRRWVPLLSFKARETQALRLRATCPRPLWKH